MPGHSSDDTTDRLKLIKWQGEKQLTNHEVASLMGVNIRTVEKWRAGTQRISRQSWRALQHLMMWKGRIK